MISDCIVYPNSSFLALNPSPLCLAYVHCGFRLPRPNVVAVSGYNCARNSAASSPPLKLFEIIRALTGPDLPISAHTTGMPASLAFCTAGPIAPGSTGVETIPLTFWLTRVFISCLLYTSDAADDL